MKGKDLLEFMELIAPAYIEEAEVIAKEKRKSHVKGGVIAACLCLFFGMIIVFTTSEFGTQIIDFFNGKIQNSLEYDESGYDLSVNIKKIPISELEGQTKFLFRKGYREGKKTTRGMGKVILECHSMEYYSIIEDIYQEKNMALEWIMYYLCEKIVQKLSEFDIDNHYQIRYTKNNARLYFVYRIMCNR